MADDLEVFYCESCWEMLPYIGCAHNCPGDWLGNNDEFRVFAKKRGSSRFLEEYRLRNQVLEVLPNVPGQEYDLILRGEGDEAYHIRQEGEVVPEGVEVLRVREILPGQYERIDQ